MIPVGTVDGDARILRVMDHIVADYVPIAPVFDFYPVSLGNFRAVEVVDVVALN